MGRRNLFAKDGDFEAFERSVGKALESRPMWIRAYCLMPNYWYFTIWFWRDGDLGTFMVVHYVERNALRGVLVGRARALALEQPYSTDIRAKRTATDLGLKSTVCRRLFKK